EREGAEGFAERVASGEVEQAGPPTPRFADLTRRLGVGGIRAELENQRLAFRFAPPEGDSLKLAHPVPHPWISEQELTEIGAIDGSAEYDALVEANSRMERMMESAPESLRQKALVELKQRVKDYFDVLLTPEHLRMSAQILFSGRTVLAPGFDLPLDQVGIADEMAWMLFGPVVAREIGGDEAQARSDRAAKSLDEIMARSWVLLNRAPTVMPTSILAFHPVRIPDNTIRLHPLACMLMNADFDGDQAAIFLPVTEAAQKEAGERLSVAAHLRRDPSLVTWVFPNHETLWGLAALSMRDDGRKKIEKLAGTDAVAPEGFATRASITQALRTIMERDGVEKIKSGARGSLGGLQRLVGPTVVQSSIHGDCIPIRHGFNEGLTPEEMFICIVGAREGLQRTAIECMQAGYGVRGYSQPKGFSVLNRAMRSGAPGIVFARAAAIGESDPLADVDSRLFVGLPATW
ncbi:MAG: hypothetical protein NTU88_12525, partial [Armatimonadetes bacterium]|nr:hypothetical protein [Armatimonadota bacterium]